MQTVIHEGNKLLGSRSNTRMDLICGTYRFLKSHRSGKKLFCKLFFIIYKSINGCLNIIYSVNSELNAGWDYYCFIDYAKVSCFACYFSFWTFSSKIIWNLFVLGQLIFLFLNLWNLFVLGQLNVFFLAFLYASTYQYSLFTSFQYEWFKNSTSQVIINEFSGQITLKGYQFHQNGVKQ